MRVPRARPVVAVLEASVADADDVVQSLWTRRGPSRGAQGVLVGILAATWLTACGAAEPQRFPTAEKASEMMTEDEQEPLGNGFVVWESNRSGAWRIWIRELDGGEARQLSADEPGRVHCCAHIAPDGDAIAFLSSDWKRPEYAQGGKLGELRRIELATGRDQALVAEARTYSENRAVVWRDNSELIYLDSSGATRLLELATLASTELLEAPETLPGRLLDAGLGYGSSNQPSFSPYDPSARRLLARAGLGGCQPYFSHDGVWGFWTAGAGGPIDRIELESRSISQILAKNDPRIPDDFGYMYFPMASRDGRLFAFGASRSEHDHFRSDYEIFVAESDPETLEILGPAKRMTRHPATDRYPDAFLAPSPLGDFRGEAPLKLSLETDSAGEWLWDLGDGRQSAGRSIETTYSQPGRYRPIARLGERSLAGRVLVLPERKPTAISATPRTGGQQIEVVFDEVVRPAQPRMHLESGLEVVGWSLSDAGRSLWIDLAEPLEAGDRVHLEGFEDLARESNAMQPASLEVEPPLWPTEQQGLAFRWATGDALNLVADPEGGGEHAAQLRPTGQARFDRHWALVLGGGSFRGEGQAIWGLRQILQSSHELTLEVTLHPDPSFRGAGRIVSLARVGRRAALALDQEGDRLVLVLAMAPRGRDLERRFELLKLDTARKCLHIAVTYRPGRLRAYLDGELILASSELTADFFHWKDSQLIFGDAVGGGRDWSGQLEGIALWSRELEPSTLRDDALRYRRQIEARAPIEGTELIGRLLRRAPAPSLKQISPYREALAVFEYELVRLLHGPSPGPRVQVAHWSLLDGQKLALNQAPISALYRIRIEPFAEHPEVASLYLSTSPGGHESATLYLAPDPELRPELMGTTK